MVLYLAAEYPNFLGSAWNYSTNVVYSTGLDGRAVRPAGTWNEDIERALGMNWEYQGHTKLCSAIPTTSVTISMMRLKTKTLCHSATAAASNTSYGAGSARPIQI